MSTEPTPPFVPSRNQHKILMSKFAEMLGRALDRSVSELVDHRNMLRLNHGKAWTHGDLNDTSELKRQTAEVHISQARLADGDFSLLVETIEALRTQIDTAFKTSIFATITESCNQNGQTVQATEESLPDQFMTMLRKISFGIDENGEPSLPQVHIGPGNPLVRVLQSQPPEFHAKLQELVEEKKEEARRSEFERRAKFRKAPFNE